LTHALALHATLPPLGSAAGALAPGIEENGEDDDGARDRHLGEGRDADHGQRILDDAEKRLKDYYPVFRDMRIAERWAGCIDATPDAVPVISKVEALPGLHLCTGFSGHGFGLGPGAGKLMAEIVMGERTCVDASAFRYGRFFDGTRPRPTTGL
jgi:glycine/D-amino acid oxidase-like deaminating enzyme